jgi:UPF0755 protein
MTIRQGGRPRDERTQAGPVDEGVYDPAAWSDQEPRRRAASAYRRNQRGGGGLGGLLRFLLFALILAAFVLIAAVTVLRPIVRGAIVGWASDNPAALGLPFVADLMREELGTSLTRAASDDPAQAAFTVKEGDTASTIANRLKAQGFVTDPRAFVFIAMDRKVATKLNAGDYVLRRNMTPDQLVTALFDASAVTHVDILIREAVRLEQITAKLETLPLTMDVHHFYDLVKHPPDTLIADYPWLQDLKLPKGTSLEGFLYPATYSVKPDVSPEELVGLMLDKFHTAVTDARMTVPKARGLTFYQVLTLASIVEREAVLDEERPIIAGVYQNRLNGKGATQILNADPVVFYAVDSVELDKLDFMDWQKYAFWKPPAVPLGSVTLPPDLAGYQSYRLKGLPPGPICTPTTKSIDAALAPDTSGHYFYFLAIPDGGGKHVFAHNLKEHDANRAKYGYK